jgi:photosystem II stability/assembly factor-like uncharacterized protein
MTNKDVRALAVSPASGGAGATNLFAGTYGGGVFLSTNSGAGWSPASPGLGSLNVQALAVSGANVFAGTSDGGVFLSTDSGGSWTAANVGLAITNAQAFATSGENLFVGTSGGVYLSTNNGKSWTAVNAGLTYVYVFALAVSGTNLFVGTGGGGVWGRPLFEMITDVEGERQLPRDFVLEQNYPNPFNPTTKIQFTIVNRLLTIINVYDLVGREVATLVNGVNEPGTYTVQFDGSGLAGGVYMYRLQAGAYVQSRKLLLLH